MLAAIMWVAIGSFVAWIGTKLEIHGPAKGISNIGVAVVGELVGGLATRAALGARAGYDAFLVCAGAAMLVSALFVGITEFRAQRGLRQHGP